MVSYSSDELKEKIEEIAKGEYSSWTIGITQRPIARKREHDSPKTWTIWQADSLEIAQDVEQYFLKKGMNGGTGGDTEPDYITHVYIFYSH